MVNKQSQIYKIFVLMLLVSCVGTVEDVSKEKTLAEKYENPEVTFEGVQALRSISHDKVEVYFFPATGGSGKYSYRIYYGGEPTPQVTSSEVLNVDYRGYLRQTLTGLDSAKDYIIRVDVVDQISQAETKTTKTLSIDTFSNKVTSFYGVSDVSNLAGVDGIDSINIRWVHAECYDPLRCDQASDPASYEVILLDRTNEGLSPADFDNFDLTYDQGRIVKTLSFDPAVNSTVVRGLQGDTEYYVLVRAIHNDSVEDINNIRLRGELNSSYMQIKTLNSDLAAIEFDTSSLNISQLSGENATNSLQVDWAEAIGVFDHFRLFYGTASANLNSGSIPDDCKANFELTDDPKTTVLCKKLRSTESNALVADLLSETTYDFILVLCQTVACEAGSRIVGDRVSGSTVAVNPAFGGVDEILLAQDTNELNSLTLKFTPVDTNEYVIDGYIVEYKSSADPSTPAEYEVLETIDPDYISGRLSQEPFNYLTDSKVVVSGIQYYSGANYCFRIFPFNYDTDGNKVKYTNENWSCVSSPEYEAPSKSEFEGLKATRTQGGQVTLRWNFPSTGIYEEYELYYINKASSLNLFGTIPQDLDNGTSSINFGRIIIDSSYTDITLSGFEDGETYEFGILTKYNSSRGPLRSEENSNIVLCEFSDSTILDCSGGL